MTARLSGSYTSPPCFRISGKETAKDMFQLSRYVTLHFPLVENHQPSFSILGGVLVLLFAS